MEIDLDKLSDRELKKLIDSAEQIMRKNEENRRKDGISQIKKIAASIGVQVQISKLSSRRGVRVPPKYRNPNNKSQKWSGRGMKPKWVKALLEDGHALDEFKIR